MAFEVVAKQKNLVQEGIYRQNGNMNLILGLKLVNKNYWVLYNYCIRFLLKRKSYVSFRITSPFLRSKIVKLSNRVDVEKGRVEKLKEVDNVHLITGLVKMFFK